MEVEQDGKPLQRVTVPFKNENGDFIIREHSFGNQYSQIYHARFHVISPWLRDLARTTWPDIQGLDATQISARFHFDLVVNRILDVAGRPDLCVIIGTVYKQSKLRTSAIKYYEQQRTLSGFRPSGRCTHPEDYIVLEVRIGDWAPTYSTCRCYAGRKRSCSVAWSSYQPGSLRHRPAFGAISHAITGFPSGAVLAVRGNGLPNGDFVVTDVLAPGIPMQVPVPSPDPGL